MHLRAERIVAEVELDHMNTLFVEQLRQLFVDALHSTVAPNSRWQERSNVQAYTFAMVCDCGAEMHLKVQASLVHEFLCGKISAAEVLPDAELYELAKWAAAHVQKGGRLRKGIVALLGRPKEKGSQWQN